MGWASVTSVTRARMVLKDGNHAFTTAVLCGVEVQHDLGYLVGYLTLMECTDHEHEPQHLPASPIANLERQDLIRVQRKSMKLSNQIKLSPSAHQLARKMEYGMRRKLWRQKSSTCSGLWELAMSYPGCTSFICAWSCKEIRIRSPS
ncbi:hypothetical protein MPH_04066 [Macrophomina phaseolina MS6]|uniref:Uncharacterized protein n=1 Tax=Macrophomina phaseolina (strain MS6) TaxID=1126212 RepID=K2RV52_MACPH|nr:hypothetical protein MPH_04066 [Macrophomina phaseolina MS6]